MSARDAAGVIAQCKDLGTAVHIALGAASVAWHKGIFLTDDVLIIGEALLERIGIDKEEYDRLKRWEEKMK